jgi:hypothetical protein
VLHGDRQGLHQQRLGRAAVDAVAAAGAGFANHVVNLLGRADDRIGRADLAATAAADADLFGDDGDLRPLVDDGGRDRC